MNDSSKGLRLLVMSDTHVPKRAKELPATLWSAVAEADVVIHAGDWVDAALLTRSRRARRGWSRSTATTTASSCEARLPEVATATLAGVRLAVVHETGSAKGRERRCMERFPGIDVLVFGHSHIPWDSTAENGLRLLNPGSPTDRRAQPHRTYLTATARDGSARRLDPASAVSGVDTVLGSRPRRPGQVGAARQNAPPWG
jgi:putative phosphoesterase